MTATSIIGYLAAVLATICWLPQVTKTLRSRQVDDLSLGTNLMLLTAVILWLIYGILLGEWPMIIANTVSILCIGTIVTAKLIWGHKE